MERAPSNAEYALCEGSKARMQMDYGLASEIKTEPSLRVFHPILGVGPR